MTLLTEEEYKALREKRNLVRDNIASASPLVYHRGIRLMKKWDRKLSLYEREFTVGHKIPVQCCPDEVRALTGCICSK